MVKVLMFGWEFPPRNSGGLGVACRGLTAALSALGTKITLVLPSGPKPRNHPCKIILAGEKIEMESVDSPLSAYASAGQYRRFLSSARSPGTERAFYGPDLFAEVEWYGEKAAEIAGRGGFDLIHAHDWLSAPAGLKAKEISGRPLVFHVHATEFDRTGGNGADPRVYEIEKKAMEKADAVIANSNFTKRKITSLYGISPEKVKVVYNAADAAAADKEAEAALEKAGRKIVLFAGRITLQKGPDYFLAAAKKALERKPDILFVMAGAGDMEPQIIEEAARLDIAGKVLFAGFLGEKELAAAYRAASLYVLPSVSEPFGITPLESLRQGTPVLISRQSGVSEVISHALKADFWDTDEMANKMLAALEYEELAESLKKNGQREAEKLTWRDSARQCLGVYSEILEAAAGK